MRIARKAGRRLVCVLVLLVACAGAAWATGSQDVYKTISSASQLEWSVSSNWMKSTDGKDWNATDKTWEASSNTPDIDGSDEVSVVLFSDVHVTGDLIFNNSGSNTVSVYLNGHTLTVGGTIIIGVTDPNGGDSGSNIHNADVYFYGSGSVVTQGLDTTNKKTINVYLNESVDFTIKETFFGNLDSGGSLQFISDGTATLYIPASGANVNWGPNKVQYVPDTSFLRPAGTPLVYTVTSDGADPSQDSGMQITLTRQGTGSNMYDVAFGYTVTSLTGGSTWTLSGTNLSEGHTGSITLSKTTPNTTLQLKSNRTLLAGDSIVISFKTPDGTMELAEIRCGSSNSEVVWKGTSGGTSGDSWTESTNWTWPSGVTVNVAFKESAQYIIPAGCPSYPKLTGNLEVGSIVIKNNARVEQTGGTLTVSSLSAAGTGKFTSTAGTVKFKGADASWEAEYPDYSAFTNIEIADSACFTPASDLYVSGNLTNTGTGQFAGSGAAVYLQNGNHEISGNGSASNTSFGQLYCTDHGGKAITFAGKITVDGLNLSGTSDDSRLSVKGSSGAEIKVTTSPSGYYLALEAAEETNAAPAVTGGTFSAYSSALNPSTGSVPSGWVCVSNAYVWKGTASTAWNAGGNWSTGNAPSGTDIESIIIPATTAVAPSAPPATVTISETFEVARQVDWSSQDLTISGTGSVKFGNGSPCVIKLKSLTVTNSGSFTVSENCTLIVTNYFSRTGTADTVVAGTIKSTSGDISLMDGYTGTVTVSANASFQSSNSVHLGTVAVQNAWTASSLSITTLKIPANATFTQGSGVTISEIDIGSASSSNVTLTLGADLKAGTVKNYGTINLNGHTFEWTTSYNSGLTGVNDVVQASGSVTVKGTDSGTIGTLLVSDTATIAGTFSCKKFRAAELGGKTLTVNGTVSVDTLQLTGTSAARLNVAGSGSFRLSALQSGGRFLTVSGPSVTNASGASEVMYTAASSEKATGTNPSGWEFPADSPVVWTGTESSAWNTAANWDVGRVPEPGDSVTIPRDSVTIPGTVSTFPIIADTFTIPTVYITIESGAELTLAADVTCGSFTNSGTLKLAASVTLNAASTWEEGCTIEYYSASGSADINELTGTGKPETSAYSGMNLIIDDGVTMTAAGDVSVSSIINNGVIAIPEDIRFASYSGSGVVQLTGSSSQMYGTGTSSTISTVQVSSDCGLATQGSVSIDTLKIDPGKELSLVNGLSVGTINNKGSIVLSGNDLTWTTAYSGASDASDTIQAAGSVTVNGSGTGTGAVSLFKVTGTATLAGTFSCKQFIATDLGDETLTMNASVTVGSGVTGDAATQTLQLSGSDEAHKLNIAGNGTFSLNTAQSGGKWLAVGSGPSISLASGLFSASYSTGSDPAPTGWRIVAGALEWVWTGAVDNAWGTAGNWNVSVVPDENSDVVLNENAVCETPAGTAVTVKTLTLSAGSAMITLLNDLTVTESITNDGCLDTNGHTLTFKEYHDAESALIKIGAAGGIALYTGGSVQTISNVEFTETRTFTDSTSFSFGNATVDSGVELTLVSLAASSNIITFGGTFTNNGTVNLAGSSLTAEKYAGTGGFNVSGLVTLKSTGADASASGAISSVTSSGTTTISQDGFFTIGAFTVSDGTLRLNSNLTLTGLLSNAGTVNTNSKKLTFGSYSDTSGSGSALVQIAADNALALYSGGTGGEIKNLEFTGSGQFAFTDVDGLSFVNVTVGSSVNLTLNAISAHSNVFTIGGKLTNNGKVKLGGNVTVTGTVDNNSSINCDNRILTVGGYTHTNNASGDEVQSNGGSIILTGDGSYTISKATLNATATVTYNGDGSLLLKNCAVSGLNNSLTTTNHGNGTLKFENTTFSADGKITQTAASGKSLPVFTTVTVGNGRTLTLNSALVAGTINNNGKIKLSDNNLSWSSGYNGKSDGTDEVIASGTVTVGPTGSATGTIGVFSVSDTATIGGVFSCKKFTGTNLGGKTLTINGTITVGSGTTGNAAAQTLYLSGIDGSLLTIAGSGTIKLNKSQTIGMYLDVSPARPEITKINPSDDDVMYTTTFSIGTSGNGWNICDGELVYVWTGNAGTTSWTTGKNWSVYLAPVNTDDNVKIATATYYPETSQNLSLKNLTVETGASVTVASYTLGFKTYSGSGTVILKSNGNLNVISGGSGGTVENLKYAESHVYTAINNLAVKNVTVDPGVELTLNSNLSLASGGALTNYGTIDMRNNNLICDSFTDDAASLIKLGTGTFNPGSASTLNNIEFRATRDFENITNLTITNGTVDSGAALTITSGGLSFAGTLTNNGTISLQSGDLTVGGALDNNGIVNIGSRTLQFALYQHTANTLTDAFTIAGGSITAATGGNGTGMIAVSSLTMNGNATVTNNSNGALKFTAVTVNAVSQLSAGGTGNAPVFSALNITSNSTLTLASNISAGNVIIADGATLDADSRASDPTPPAADSATSAYGCTTFGGGYVLTVSGNFINYNTGHSNATPYPGFVAQHGRVEITGIGTHEIRGNNKFHDFVCISPGATLIFDANKTTNVDHQIWLEGSGSNLITLKTDNAAEGDKWTLDVIWSDVDGTAEHRKPHINYVAPHKSRSYSAKLKGCLVGCVDDAPSLRDSTNVNWFDDMPTIIMTVAPVGGKQLAVMFSSEVDAVSGTDLRTSVALKTNTGSNLIDPSVPVSMYTGSSDKSKTTVVYGLTRELTWNDLFGSDCLHVEVIQSGAVLVRGTNIKYQQGVKHCASDFAINAARMLFGYDNYIDSSTPLTIEKGSNSVRTWDQSDPISNRLHSDSDLLFQAQFDASVPAGMKLEMVAMLDSQLNKSIISDNYMDYYGLSTRLWLPTQFQPISTAQQSVPSSQMISQDSTSSGRLRNFSLHYSKTSSSPLFQMKDGEEIQFLFKVKNSDNSDLSVDHDYVFENGVFTPVSGPVYAIRLVDDADITSFDLWSVMLEATTLQRGNVTILNNVINSDKKEQTFVTIQMQKAGSLTVQVLTLDGSVITTLQRGRKAAGTYGYSWDGTNGKGKAVARGMYFIRVIGPDIDETRKVMVVRD